MLNSKREALRLYREILKTANKYLHYPDEKGRLWYAFGICEKFSEIFFFVFFLLLQFADLENRNEVIRESTRKEFELAKFEKDPHIIAKLLLVGRQSLDNVTEKV